MNIQRKHAFLKDWEHGEKSRVYRIAQRSRATRARTQKRRKKFTRMITKFPCSEETALKSEQEKIESYQRSHGSRKPRYNE